MLCSSSILFVLINKGYSQLLTGMGWSGGWAGGVVQPATVCVETLRRVFVVRVPGLFFLRPSLHSKE